MLESTGAEDKGAPGCDPSADSSAGMAGRLHSPPQNETQKTPPDISLLRAKNGLDNGSTLAIETAAVMVLILSLCVAMTRFTNGTFVYPLDDTYIGMAIARNLAMHGVLGITSREFSSSGSSPLFWALRDFSGSTA
jgi:hypothetical protein